MTPDNPISLAWARQKIPSFLKLNDQVLAVKESEQKYRDRIGYRPDEQESVG